MDEHTRRRANWVVGSAAILAILAMGAWAAGGAAGDEGPEGPAPEDAAASEVSAAREAVVLDETLSFYEQRYQRDPNNPVAARELIDGYRRRFRTEARMSDLHRAEEIAESMVPVALDRAAFLGRLATVRLDLHRFEGALRAARKAVDGHGGSTSALAGLFDAAWAVGQYAVAESALAKLPAGSFARRFREAQLLEGRGRMEEAVRLQARTCRRLERGSAARQTVAWCLTRLAGLAHQQAGPGTAEQFYRRARDLRPGYRGAIEGLADLAYARQEWERAEELYRRILTDAHPDLRLRLAEVLRAQGRAEEAATHARAFRSLTSDSTAEVLSARPLALHEASRGNRDRALSLIRRDLERRNVAGGYEVLAWIRLQRGEPREALEASDRARRMMPGGPGATSDYHRARILEALGRTEEAERLYELALAEPTLLAHHALQDLWARAR